MQQLVLGVSGFCCVLLLGAQPATATPSLLSSSLVDVQEIDTQETGIIGGTDVAAGSYIAQTVVSVYDQSSDNFCTGVILADNIIVTAAHCLGEKPENMFVVFGLNFQNAMQFPVDKFQPSPYWNTPGTIPGDIALLHFAGNMPSGFRAATLLPSGYLQNTMNVTLAGYGINDEQNQTGAGVLRMASASIANAAYSTSEVEVNQNNGQGACEGDSGGPGYISVNGQYYLWGVTDGGIDPTCRGLAIYTNISFYSVWIQNTSAKLSTSMSSLYFP